MSDSTPTGSGALANAPTDPVVGLTGAPATIYTELLAITNAEGTSAAALSQAAGLSRSTAGKALVTLEQRGLAVRTRGGHDGPHRIPDLWRATPTPDEGRQPPVEPASLKAETTPVTTPDTQATDEDRSLAADALPFPIGTKEQEKTSSPVTNTVATAPPQQTSPPQEPPAANAEGKAQNTDEASSVPLETDAPTPHQSHDAPSALHDQTVTSADSKRRLAPGELRHMVLDHLRQHPNEAFTATKISRMIERSSGAITNALDKLVRQGMVEQVTERPRTYRMAASADGPA